MTSTKEQTDKQAISKAANVVMSAPKDTYYAAIRDLAQIVLEELPEDRLPSESLQWGFFMALANMVRENLPGLTLDTKPGHAYVTAEKVAHRLLELCAKAAK